MRTDQRRLLELAGLLRRGTPDYLITEGDDDGGGDDLFADDGGGDEGGDDSGGDDLFGDDEGGGEGEEDEGKDAEPEEEEPAEELSPTDIKKYGTPTFEELDSKLSSFFEECKTAAPVKKQEVEAYPGTVEEEEEDEVEKELAEEGYSRREINLVTEGLRLLREASEEGLNSENFDINMFAQKVSHLIVHRETQLDLPGTILNAARQMILNSFGKEGELEFMEYLKAEMPSEELELLGLQSDQFDGEGADVPSAIGAGGEGGGV
jgi:hypothetical protein